MNANGLSPDFHFSQSSLQDYVDCPRRFELRYMLRQAWPVVQAQPIQRIERLAWLGSAFHRLVHQYMVGIPPDSLAQSFEDEDLHRWWQAFRDAPLSDLPAGVRLAEISMFTYIAGYRLAAKYDLIAADDRRVVVVDWKTNQHRPSSSWLSQRLQTRVYPYVVVETGEALCQFTAQHDVARRVERANSPRVTPEQVAMVYWFAEFPRQPEWFHYSLAQHQENRDFLTALIAEIAAREPGDFPQTDDEQQCRFCVYRSLCEKNFAAGDMADEAELETDVDRQDWQIDLEQAAEIAY